MKALAISPPADVELEPFHVRRIVRLALGQWRKLDGVVEQERRLNQVGAHELLQHLVDDSRPDRIAGDIGPGRARRSQETGLVRERRVVDTAGLPDRITQRDPRERRAQVDLDAIVGETWFAEDVDRYLPDQLLGHRHDLLVVGVGLVPLQHGEFRLVVAVHPFVAEVLADFVDALEATDDQPLQDRARRRCADRTSGRARDEWS